jgi:eukaryotic-like serine/threonine-protein kinase
MEPFSARNIRTMICPHCGGATEAPDGRCTSCGHPISSPPPAEPPTPPPGTDSDKTVLGPPGSAPFASDQTVLSPPPQAPTPDPGPRTGVWPVDVTRLMPSSDPGVTVAAGPGMSTHHGGAGTPPFPSTPPSVVSNPPPGAAVKAVGGMTGTFGQGAMGGQPFGPRYHLVRLLGAGGMGAVYQAWDQELGVVVAIKVIKPEAMENPEAARELERRFKRELLLARNVTHKNVVRIHDLGEVEGVKYITMPYVHGSDLGSVIKREHKVPLTRALNIAKQIAAGLVAAHDAGVVHRDLKPANILLDENDHALITDFGIARSTSGTAGGTVLGTVVGTLDYMAPEQARGQAVDHRADIYAFGLMLSDMLIGRRQTGHGGESSLAALMNRMTTIMPPIRSVDPNIPQTVSDIVSRCTALDAEHRYAKTKELLKDLESLDDHGHPTDGSVPAATHAWTQPLPHTMPGQMVPGQTVPGQMYPGQTMPGQTMPGQTVQFPGGAVAQRPSKRRWLLVAAAVAGLAIGTGAFIFRGSLFGGGGAAVATRSVSIVILPFHNGSGDRSLDRLGQTIAEELRTQIGQSRALRTVSSADIGQILSDLRITQDTRLDPERTKQLASYTKADVVISGEFGKFGERIQITANVEDLPQGTSDSVPASAENQTVLLATIGQLATAIRDKLKLAPDDLKAATAASYRPSSKSLSALTKYNEGMALVREGKLNDAVKAFTAATEEDKEFALAFGRLALTYVALGMPSEAERHARTAERLSGALPEVEKFMVLAHYARVMKNRAEAVGFYDKLAKMLPGSDEVLADLAAALDDSWDFDRAFAEYTKLAERNPNSLDALMGIGRVQVRRDQSQPALEPLTQALNIAVKRDNLDGQATARMWIGVAYRIQGKSDLALNEFTQALKIARQLDRKRMSAEIILEMGKVQADLGKFDQALRQYNESMALRKEMKDQQAIGDALIDFGNAYANTNRLDQALNAFNESLRIQREEKNYNFERIVLSNIGAVNTIRNEHQTALTYYQNALAAGEKINNPGYKANALYNVGETQIRLGRYVEAEQSLVQAIALRRQANDDRGGAQVKSALAKLFGYQARFDAAYTTAKEAYDAMERLKESTGWTVIHRAEYGAALGNLGRVEEANKVLESAEALARKLQIPPLLADVLNYRGDVYLRQGDLKQARTQYDEASKAAAAGGDPQRIGLSKLHLAMTDAKEGRQGADKVLINLAAEADKWGFKAESVSASVALGESLVAAKQYAQAQGVLETAFATSERIGLKVQVAQSHYWLSQALASTGNSSGARQHLQDAQRELDKIKAEAKDNTATLLKRADLAPIAAAK